MTAEDMVNQRYMYVTWETHMKSNSDSLPKRSDCQFATLEVLYSVYTRNNAVLVDGAHYFTFCGKASHNLICEMK